MFFKKNTVGRKKKDPKDLKNQTIVVLVTIDEKNKLNNLADEQIRP